MEDDKIEEMEPALARKMRTPRKERLAKRRLQAERPASRKDGGIKPPLRGGFGVGEVMADMIAEMQADSGPPPFFRKC